MKLLEKKFQTQFSHWVKEHATYTFAYELKSVDTSCPFSAVADHQIEGLWHAKHGKLCYKIPDLGMQNPFDGFALIGVLAYVIIRYSSGNWYAIDIDVFKTAKDHSIRRSLVEGLASELSTFKYVV